MLKIILVFLRIILHWNTVTVICILNIFDWCHDLLIHPKLTVLEEGLFGQWIRNCPLMIPTSQLALVLALLFTMLRLPSMSNSLLNWSLLNMWWRLILRIDGVLAVKLRFRSSFKVYWIGSIIELRTCVNKSQVRSIKLVVWLK